MRKSEAIRVSMQPCESGQLNRVSFDGVLRLRASAVGARGVTGAGGPV